MPDSKDDNAEYRDGMGRDGKLWRVLRVGHYRARLSRRDTPPGSSWDVQLRDGEDRDFHVSGTLDEATEVALDAIDEMRAGDQDTAEGAPEEG